MSVPPPYSSLSDEHSDFVFDLPRPSKGAVASSLIACPDELLAEIFSYGCAGPNDYVDAQILRSNPDRARAPFIVAAVCQHWRTVTLNHSALWHYLTIPTVTGNKAGRVLEWLPSYINTMLDRSRDAPIDVIIEYINVASGTVAVMEPIFTALEKNSRRWRRFAVAMYGVPVVTRVLAMLTQPTPSLRTLELARQSPTTYNHTFHMLESDADVEDSFDETVPQGQTFLPDISGLRFFSLVNVPQVVRHWPTNSIQNVNFYTLQVIQHVLTVQACDMLSRQYADAGWLLLNVSAVEQPMEPLQLVFPKLDLIWIYNNVYELLARYSLEIRTPVLREIVMAGGRLSALTPWLCQIRAHLRNLDLRWLDKFDEADIDALVTLEQLEVIEICGRTRIPSRMLSLMGQDGSETEAGPKKASRVVWPRLHLFELNGTQFDDSEGDLTPQLVKLARMRAHDGPPDQHGMPRWVKLELGFFGWRILERNQIDMMRSVGAEVRVG